MKFSERREGNVAVISLQGRFTLGDGDQELRDASKRLLDAGVKYFVFDFTDVPYMDSAALGELIACNKRAREKGGIIRLVLNMKTTEILVIGGVMRVFEVFDDVPSALKGFG